MERLRQEILKLCNESGLPLEAIYFIIKDIMRDAQISLDEFNKQQMIKKEEEEEKEEEKNES